MDAAECERVARDWVALQYAARRSATYDELFLAWEQLDDLVHHDPETAWVIIGLIWQLDQTEKVLASLAAGPVEDLLVYHGELIIDRAVATARQEPVFRKLLGAVWRNRIAAPVWARLRQIADPSF